MIDVMMSWNSTSSETVGRGADAVDILPVGWKLSVRAAVSDSLC